MKKLFISLFAMLSATTAMAQFDDTDKQIFNHVGAGVSVGTDGIGINLATTISPYVQMRAGVSFLPSFKIDNITIDAPYGELQQVQRDLNNSLTQSVLSQYVDADLITRLQQANFDREIEAKIKLNMTNFKLLFDLYPTKTSPWHLTVGFYAGKSQFVKAENDNYHDELQLMTDYNAFLDTDRGRQAQQAYRDYYGSTLPRMEATLGDETIEPNGRTATAYVKVNSFKPYLGIGSGRALNRKHLTFSWDLGAQFWSTPKFYLQEKQMDKTGDSDVDDVIDVVKDFKVYPTLSIRLNGRFL